MKAKWKCAPHCAWCGNSGPDERTHYFDGENNVYVKLDVPQTDQQVYDAHHRPAEPPQTYHF